MIDKLTTTVDSEIVDEIVDPLPPPSTSMVVGYRLIDAEGMEFHAWGGTWGRCPGIPNPLRLPNGAHVHAPSLNVDYGGYTLVEWVMDEPAPSVPAYVTPRQVRLLLLQQGLLETVKAMIEQQEEAVRIEWEYATEFRRDNPLLPGLAASLGLTDEQIDAFFIAAAQL